WLPLAPRIALRDTARNRTAAAPAIAAVMAAVIGSLAIGVILNATDERDRLDYRSTGRPGDVALYHGGKSSGATAHGLPADTLAAVRATMPVVNAADINLASCPDRECVVGVRIPPDRECPFSRAVVQRDPTTAEQRAARHDPRCANVGRSGVYFG